MSKKDNNLKKIFLLYVLYVQYARSYSTVQLLPINKSFRSQQFQIAFDGWQMPKMNSCD
jgi:hypothetical protein